MQRLQQLRLGLAWPPVGLLVLDVVFELVEEVVGDRADLDLTWQHRDLLGAVVPKRHVEVSRTVRIRFIPRVDPIRKGPRGERLTDKVACRGNIAWDVEQDPNACEVLERRGQTVRELRGRPALALFVELPLERVGPLRARADEIPDRRRLQLTGENLLNARRNPLEPRALRFVALEEDRDVRSLQRHDPRRLHAAGQSLRVSGGESSRPESPRAARCSRVSAHWP